MQKARRSAGAKIIRSARSTHRSAVANKFAGAARRVAAGDENNSSGTAWPDRVEIWRRPDGRRTEREHGCFRGARRAKMAQPCRDDEIVAARRRFLGFCSSSRAAGSSAARPGASRAAETYTALRCRSAKEWRYVEAGKSTVANCRDDGSKVHCGGSQQLAELARDGNGSAWRGRARSTRSARAARATQQARLQGAAARGEARTKEVPVVTTTSHDGTTRSSQQLAEEAAGS